MLLLWRLKEAEMVSTVFDYEMLTGKWPPFAFYSPSLTPTCVIGTVLSIRMQQQPIMFSDKPSWNDIGYRPILDKTSKFVLMIIQLVVEFFVFFSPSLDNPPTASIVKMKTDRHPIILLPCSLHSSLRIVFWIASPSVLPSARTKTIVVKEWSFVKTESERDECDGSSSGKSVGECDLKRAVLKFVPIHIIQKFESAGWCFWASAAATQRRNLSEANWRFGVAISPIGVAISRIGVAISRFGVAISRFGLAIRRFGLAIRRFGVAISRIGVAIRRFGVAISRFGVERSIPATTGDVGRDADFKCVYVRPTWKLFDKYRN